MSSPTGEQLPHLFHRQGSVLGTVEGGTHDILSQAVAPPTVEESLKLEVKSFRSIPKHR